MSTAEERHQKNLQRIQKLRLFDDDFMTKCFEDNLECTELVLQILMNKSDLKVKKCQTQYVIKNLQGRSVRLDVKATDKENKEYDIEIQRADKGAGKKRARHNSAMMDASALQPQQDVECLPESYVIFVTEHDLFGMDKPIYPVERCIMADEKQILFEDGSHILYVNGAYHGDSAIGKLMHDFSCTDPDTMYYSVLAERVRYFKENEKGVAAMCKVMEDMLQEENIEKVKKMIKENISKEIILKVGFTEAEYEKAEEELSASV